MSDHPALTVVVPVWNRERFVGACIESILAQTFTDFELLIVDDGSTDRSPRIVRRYADRDNRIRVIQQAKTGCYAARNAALAATRGEWTAIVDSDDVALPHRMERQVAFLRSRPDHAAVGTWAVFTDPYLIPNRVVRPPTEHEAIDQRHLSGTPGGLIHPTAMCRTELIRRVGGYRLAPSSADYDLFLKLAEMGRLANLPHVHQQVRTHYRSISSTMRGDQISRARQYAHEARVRRGVASASDRLPEPRRTAVQESIVSAADQARSWALHAIHMRQRWAARRHACSLLRRKPLSRESWRVLRWSVTG